ncbi:MAG: MotA/TolQ/ExbB proton channel family protein [Spirochaetes bacterium]|nr:MotA/TolQ/ExbB proton channel family protein [Spirochaetota bacterium]
MPLALVDYGESFIFIVLLIASIVALAVFLERTIVYKRETSKKTSHFIRELVTGLRKPDFDEVRALVQVSETSIYSRFAQFFLENSHSQEGITDLMEGKIIEEKIQLEKRLPILNTLGNNAPFIGLLGTVLGVIKAFHGLGTLGNTGAEVVMRSISSALLATAAGLFVAIPVVMANNYFTRKVKVILQNMEMLTKEFTACLISSRKGR